MRWACWFPRTSRILRSAPFGRRTALVATALALTLALVSAGDSATTGKLTQLAATDGCQSDTGDAGACADGRGLNGALGVAVSRDGMNVYVASDISDAVAVFFRSPFTGELVQLAGLDGCVQDTGLDGCADGKASTGLAPWP